MTEPSSRYPSVSFALVRHGQARSRSSDSLGESTPLSQLGMRQASAIATRLLDGETLDAVYASPLPRAVQTAEPLVRGLGLKSVFDERLAEFDLGEMPLAEAHGRPDLLYWRHDHTGADGVTLGSFCDRVSAFFDEVARTHLDGRVAVVCHSGTIDAALRWAFGIAATQPWTHDFDISNASLTELTHWPDGRVAGGAPRYSSIERIGDDSHLGALRTGL